MVEVGDRVVILGRHHGHGTEFTVTKVVDDVVHYVEGREDNGSLINVPLHWVEVVGNEGER